MPTFYNYTEGGVTYSFDDVFVPADAFRQGNLWTWGANGAGQLGINNTIQRSTLVTTFAGGTNWKQVACGYNHTAAIKTDGTLWVWGNNNEVGNAGALGTNDAIYRSTPVTTFAGGTNWKQVSCGYRHTAAIKTDGTLWTWGRTQDGELGNNVSGFILCRSTPVTTFAGGTNWKQVSARLTSTAAIKTDGTLWTWGNNYFGQLGDNTSTARSTPVTTFAGGTNWKQVASGYAMAAIKTDGTLWTWGNNINGQLGNNTFDITYTPVTTFAGGSNWKQVACGFNNTSAIKTDGTLWTWGFNYYGQLGINLYGGTLNLSITGTMSTNDSVFYATDLKGLTLGNMLDYVYNGNNQGDLDMDDLFYNYFPVDVINIDTVNKTITFGSATYIGPGFTGDLLFSITPLADRNSPVTTFAGGTNWKQVVGGQYHTAAIKTDGTLWTWGNNYYGQLGDNTTTWRSTPVTTFAGGTNWEQVACGTYHTSAVTYIDDYQ